MNKMSLLGFRIALEIIRHTKLELGQKRTRKDKENFSDRIFIDKSFMQYNSNIVYQYNTVLELSEMC